MKTVDTRPANPFAELLRRVEITSKARYFASRRLAAHDLFSQWTLALLVVGHIVLALIIAINLPTRVSLPVLHFSTVVAGVVTLTYSLLLGLGRWGARATMIHQCGLELGQLARRLYPLKDAGSPAGSDYEVAVSDYYGCLEKYENHSRADYEVAYYEYYSATRLQRSNGDTNMEYIFAFLEHKRTLALAYVRRHLLIAFQFSHYLLSVTILWSWVLYLLWPKTIQ